MKNQPTLTVKYLEFKDADGNTISVAKKVEGQDRTGSIKLWINSPDSDNVTTVSEETYNQYMDSLASPEIDQEITQTKKTPT